MIKILNKIEIEKVRFETQFRRQIKLRQLGRYKHAIVMPFEPLFGMPFETPLGRHSHKPFGTPFGTPCLTYSRRHLGQHIGRHWAAIRDVMRGYAI